MKTGLNINSKQTVSLPRLFLTMSMGLPYKCLSIHKVQGDLCSLMEYASNAGWQHSHRGETSPTGFLP